MGSRFSSVLENFTVSMCDMRLLFFLPHAFWVAANTRRPVQRTMLKENYNILYCQNQYGYDILFIDTNYDLERSFNEL